MPSAAIGAHRRTLLVNSGVQLLWPCNPTPPPIGPGEAHVLAAALDVSPDRHQQLVETLSPAERERAARFRFPQHASRWSTSRGVLREILGRYLGMAANSVQFSSDVHGKPILAASIAQQSMQFNLSHSGGVALYALSSMAIGVDVEEARDFADMRSVAHSHFSIAENAALSQLPTASYGSGFYACWTRKEAYLKARGVGLLIPLDGFDVAVTPGRPVAILRVKGDAGASRRWSLFHLDPAPGYVGAVAIEAAEQRVSCWAWCG